MVCNKEFAENTTRNTPLISVRDVAEGYLEAVVFTDGRPGLSDYNETTFSTGARKKALADCEAFLAKLSNEQVSRLVSFGWAYTATNLGHDFWLGRNGYQRRGWDRNVLGKAEPALSHQLLEIAQEFGAVISSIGDDGLIHLEGEPDTQAEEVFVVLIGRTFQENRWLPPTGTVYRTRALALGAAMALKRFLREENPGYITEIKDEESLWYLVDPKTKLTMATVQVICTQVAEG